MSNELSFNGKQLLNILLNFKIYEENIVSIPDSNGIIQLQ